MTEQQTPQPQVTDDQETNDAPTAKAPTYRVRTYEQLWDALQRLIRREVVMSIPVDMERDADMILADGIKELMALRAKLQEQENTITALRGQTVSQVQTFTVSTADFGSYVPARCARCGRSATELPAGYGLMGTGTTGPGAPLMTLYCSPMCPSQKPPTATTNP